MIPEMDTHEAWEIVKEAAFAAACANEGPSDIAPDAYAQRVSDAVDCLDALEARAEQLRAELEGGRHEGDKGLRREYQFALEVAASWKQAYIHAKELAEERGEEP